MTCTVKEYISVPKQNSICWLQVPSWALQLSIVLSKLLMGLFGVVRAAGPPCCWFCCCCCTVSLSSFRSISAFTRSERTEQQVFDFCINSTWWHSQHDNDLMLIISLYGHYYSVFVLLVLTQVEIKDATCACSSLLLGHQSRIKGLRAGSHTACRTHLPWDRRCCIQYKFSFIIFCFTCCGKVLFKKMALLHLWLRKI